MWRDYVKLDHSKHNTFLSLRVCTCEMQFETDTNIKC